MKARHVNIVHLLFAFLGACLTLGICTRALLAAPVAPVAVELTQPDGTRFTAVPFGDEWYSGYEVDGFTILQNERDQFWYYARARSSGELVPSLRRVGTHTPGSLPRHLRDQVRLQQRATASTMPQTANGAQSGAVGSHPVLLILVDFTPSTSLTTTAAQWHQMVFSDAVGAKSVKTFYEQASYGRFTITPAAESEGTANDGIVEVTFNSAHIDTGSAIGVANRGVVRDALIAADGNVDYAAFDTDSSGALDTTELHVVTVLRGFEASYGGGAAVCTPGVWAHRGALQGVEPPLLDGVTVAAAVSGGGYVQLGEWHELFGSGCVGSTGNMATMGIVTHELGRDLNWPSLYDFDGTSAGVGYWSLMGHGLWGMVGNEALGTTPVLPDAFSKWYQGWLTPTLANTARSGVAISNSVQHEAVYQVLDNPNGIDWILGGSSGSGEYFLIENRQQIGFDAGLAVIDPAAAGCLIWHIDETRPASNSANANEIRKLVDLEEGDGVQDLDTRANLGDTGDPWPGSSSSIRFDGSTLPDSDLYDGTPSGVRIDNINTGATGCVVDFTTDLPRIVPYPGAIESPQVPDVVVTRTLVISNTGEEQLEWSIVEQSGGTQSAVAVVPSAAAPAGPIITLWEQLRNGSNGIVSDYSITQSGGAYAAADFTIGNQVEITAIFADGKDSSNMLANQSTIDWVIYTDTGGIPSGNPEDGSSGASALWHYTATITSTGVDITNNAISLDLLAAGAPPLVLAPGTYWLVVFPTYNNDIFAGPHWEWIQAAQVDAAGHWISPNLLGFTSWLPFNMVGQPFLDVAFRLEGREVCAANDLPWVSVSPTSGTTASGSGSSVTLTFDSAGQVPETYTGNLCIDSNDPQSPQVTVPLTMTVCAAPTAVSDLTITQFGSDAHLAWSDTGATQYEIYRLNNAPYQTPDPVTLIGTTAGTTFVDGSATGSTSSNNTYVVLAAAPCGTGSVTAADSNRVGEFDFPVVPGN